MKVSIVVPAYNEEKRIGKMLEAYSKYFSIISKRDSFKYEIVVVINNTKDRTEEIVRKWQKKNKNIRYLNLIRGGKGYAIIEGFKEALKRKNDLIGFVDADMSTGPEAFYDLIKKIKNYDGIIASRYLKESIVKPKQSVARIFVSRVFNFIVRAILYLPYKDTQCGAKLFKRKAIEKSIHDIKLLQWAFDVDLLYTMRKKGFKIVEVPTVWSDRDYSKINFLKAGPGMLLGVIRLRLTNSPFKDLVRIYENLKRNKFIR